MICNRCGREFKEGAKFCPYCGAPAEQKSTMPPPVKTNNTPTAQPKKKKNKIGLIIALIIAGVLILTLLAGGIGVWYLYDSYGTLDLVYIFDLGEKDESEKKEEKERDPEDEKEPEETNDPYVETSKPETTAPVESETEAAEVYVDPLEYFILNSATEYFTYDDIADFDATDCSIARNGIYARHGRKFTTEWLSDYFMQYDWYVPAVDGNAFNENVLNPVEKANIELIVAFEEYSGYR